MRTSNPAMNPAAFAAERSYAPGQAMTVQGAVNKSFILFGLLLFTASWVWGKLMTPTEVLGYEAAAQQTNSAVMPFVVGGGIVGFVVALITIFKRKLSPYTAPIYALCEGFVIGGISAIFEHSYPGIVIQAVGLTFGTLFCMLFLYKTGVVKVTQKFMMGLAAATGAVCLVYLINFVMGFFGSGIPLITSSGTFGILFSVVVVGIAAFNLVLDFHIIETGAEQGAPKYMEWYGAFALMVTMIWLYLEILRLLAKMRRR